MRSPITKLVLAACSLFSHAVLPACTDFTIPHKEGIVIAARSMEFGVNFRSHVIIRPRGITHQTTAPNGEPGLSWTSKYGFVAANVFEMDLAVDGVNEAGLSCGLLWMIGTEYQQVEPGEESIALPAHELGNWLLGNFATVDEVKEAIQKIKVWGHDVPELRMEPPLHFPVHDANGNSIVIEYVKGNLKVHDNHIGVLTNSPPFDWQVTNLDHYTHLKSHNVSETAVHGSGMRGLPGDATPPSRFVKLAVQRDHVNPVSTPAEGVRLARHLLYTVNIPQGICKSHDASDVYHENYTQWVVIKDLKNKIFYYSSYEGLGLRAIDLDKVDLRPGAKHKWSSITDGDWVVDVSAHFM